MTVSYPIQVTFRGMSASPALETEIRARAAELGEVFERITTVRVVLEERHLHSAPAGLFHVRVEASIPGETIVVDRDPAELHTHEDPYVTVRDAFDAAARQLDERADRMRGEVKAHAPGVTAGRITRVSAPEEYGFIRSSDGEDVYFHANAVVGTNLEALEEGDEVHFVRHSADGSDGPHASGVRLFRRAAKPQPRSP